MHSIATRTQTNYTSLSSMSEFNPRFFWLWVLLGHKRFLRDARHLLILRVRDDSFCQWNIRLNPTCLGLASRFWSFQKSKTGATEFGLSGIEYQLIPEYLRWCSLAHWVVSKCNRCTRRAGRFTAGGASKAMLRRHHVEYSSMFILMSMTSVIKVIYLSWTPPRKTSQHRFVSCLLPFLWTLLSFALILCSVYICVILLPLALPM